MVFYGVAGGKSFGGSFPMVNKYFNTKKDAVEYIMKYNRKYPRRKLTLNKFSGKL